MEGKQKDFARLCGSSKADPQRATATKVGVTRGLGNRGRVRHRDGPGDRWRDISGRLGRRTRAPPSPSHPTSAAKPSSHSSFHSPEHTPGVHTPSKEEKRSARSPSVGPPSLSPGSRARMTQPQANRTITAVRRRRPPGRPLAVRRADTHSWTERLST